MASWTALCPTRGWSPPSTPELSDQGICGWIFAFTGGLDAGHVSVVGAANSLGDNKDPYHRNAPSTH
jgi:hypothetical protein